MNRRSYLKVLAAALPATAVSAAPAAPIQLHCDLQVEPAKEKDLVAAYSKVFRPVIRKQPGFVDVKLLKLRSEIAGKAPANFTYRLIVSFQTEELRLKWAATDDHQKGWGAMERTLAGAKFTALLYDPVV